jgi:hypothetical protein
MEDNTRKYLRDNTKQHNRLRMTPTEIGSNSLLSKISDEHEPVVLKRFTKNDLLDWDPSDHTEGEFCVL